MIKVVDKKEIIKHVKDVVAGSCYRGLSGKLCNRIFITGIKLCNYGYECFLLDTMTYFESNGELRDFLVTEVEAELHIIGDK